MNLYVFQLIVAAIAVAGCFLAMARAQTVVAKLCFLVGLTILVFLQVLKPPPLKETTLDRKIRILEDRLKGMAEGDPERNILEKELQSHRALLEEYSPAAAQKRLAMLMAKKERTAEDEEEIRRLQERIPKWYDRLPVKLGLDLRGGTEVRLRLVPDESRLRTLERELATLEKDPKASSEKIQATKDAIASEREAINRNFDSAADVIRDRLNHSGLAEIYVTREGSDRLLVQLPGMSSAQANEIIRRLQKMGRLEFRLVVDSKVDHELVTKIMSHKKDKDSYNFSPERGPQGAFLPPEEVEILDGQPRDRQLGCPLYDWLQDDEGHFYVVEKDVKLTGDSLVQAQAVPNLEGGGFQINFRLSTSAGWLFERITRANIGRQLAIVLDGKLKSAPVLQSVISHSGRITGRFTQEEAKDLEVVLRSGSLKVQVEKEFENTVGPTLGEDSIRQGLQAMLLGFFLVVLFMLGYYLVGGVVANAALFLNLLLLLAVLSAADATLTLPGIAGLVLTVGMAVDANILIFERIREERDKGNALHHAVSLGYDRAFVTIIDANLTTFITALILHSFGTEAVRGFATTLMIGILTSMFTGIWVTRWILEALIEYKAISDLKMNRIFRRTSFDFIRWHRHAIVGSVVSILIGMAVFVWRGERNFGHDFTGGLLAQLQLCEPLSMEEARKKIAGLQGEAFESVMIQSSGEPQGTKGFLSFLVRAKIGVAAKEKSPEAVANAFKETVAKLFPLVEEGLRVHPQPISGLSTASSAVFRVDLVLKDPRSIEELQKTLKSTSLLHPWIVGIEEAPPTTWPVEMPKEIPASWKEKRERVTIYAGISTQDESGVMLDPTALPGRVQAQFQELRQQGRLDFTDPFPRFSNVGRTVAAEMERDAILALFYSMVAIFFYIWLRFQFRVGFGLGAVIALIHDVLFTLGALAILDEWGGINCQIDLVIIAALLTLVGYSLNDTIVVFDRIRENLHGSRDLKEVINLSINQTLVRTVCTSLTTLLVVVVLMLFGGEVIRGFAVTLFIGIIVGTYSSIFIASPILIEFTLWWERRRRLQREAPSPLPVSPSPQMQS